MYSFTATPLGRQTLFTLAALLLLLSSSLAAKDSAQGQTLLLGAFASAARHATTHANGNACERTQEASLELSIDQGDREARLPTPSPPLHCRCAAHMCSHKAFSCSTASQAFVHTLSKLTRPRQSHLRSPPLSIPHQLRVPCTVHRAGSRLHLTRSRSRVKAIHFFRRHFSYRFENLLSSSTFSKFLIHRLQSSNGRT